MKKKTRKPVAGDDPTRMATRKALDHLTHHYGPEVDEAIYYGFLSEPDDETKEAFAALDDDLLRPFFVNQMEWALADAQLFIDGREVVAIDLVLGSGGPKLSSAERRWLEALAGQPLSLFEVRDVKPDEGFVLRDLVRPDRPDIRVVERAASRTLRKWDMIGARPVPWERQWILSGAVYPFIRAAGKECLDGIVCALDALGGDDQEIRRIASTIILIESWIEHLLAEPDPMTIVDGATGALILLVTDRYEVAQSLVLIGILSMQSDVDGDTIDGWTRFSESGVEGIRHSRAELSLHGKKTLEVFCRSVEQADETREWLASIAPNAVRFQNRDVADPASPEAREAAQNRSRDEGGVPNVTRDIPDEEEVAAVHELLRRHYRDWLDREVPALKGKTPRQAVRTKEGRREVVEILKSIELAEAGRTDDDGTPPLDISFLWRELGLEG